MKYSHRLLIPLLAIVTLHSGTSLPSAPHARVEAPAVAVAIPAAPVIAAPAPTPVPAARSQQTLSLQPPTADELTIVGGSPEQRRSAERAVAHFTDAGLEPPGVSIVIHDSDTGCGGFEGVFRPSDWRVDVCNPHWLITLHELAHAWEHAMLSDDVREEFMDLRGLTSWNDAATPWVERGIEDLAETVVWGLRQLGGAAPRPDEEREAAFLLITGIDLETARTRTASGEERTPQADPSDRDPSFDSWR